MSFARTLFFGRKEEPNDFINLNVGGINFVANKSKLDRYPLSRLCRLRDCRNFDKCIDLLSDGYDEDDDVFYFDRDPDSFRLILKCYEGISIHLPRSLCPLRFADEKRYWAVEDAQFDVCCQQRFKSASTFVDELDVEVRNKVEEKTYKTEKAELIFTHINNCKDALQNLSKIRWYMWGMFVEPSSCFIGKIWAVVSVGFIVISLSTFVLGTLHCFQSKDSYGNEIENPVIETIEKVCITWFTFEYLVRLIISPKKLLYIRQIMNLIDLITIMPFFVQLYFTHSSGNHQELESVSHLLQPSIFQIFRVMRVMRVLRLGRHSAGLQVLCKTFVRSSTELALLGMYFVIGIILLATLEYSFEDEKFRHLGDSFWWATITVTTVGYGDITPDSATGKIIASMAFLIGVLAIGVPIHPIIANFTYFYTRTQEIECAYKRTMKRKELDLSFEENGRTSIMGIKQEHKVSISSTTRKMSVTQRARNILFNESKSSDTRRILKTDSRRSSATSIFPDSENTVRLHNQCRCTLCEESIA
ncbi:voltage-gated potassium channel regulatory subunit KCNF1-like isoform X1 [Styela clava]